jgi:uncharacterized protein (TIGR02145 family)
MRKLVSIFLILLSVSCSEEPRPPEAALTTNPTTGTIKTVFDLDASLTGDPDGISQLLESRWDFEGDGIWDTEFQKGLLSASQYSATGWYHPIVEIRDPQGLTSTASSTIGVEDVKQFTDPRDGKIYPMIQLGTLWWMGKNLDYGTEISPSQNQTNNGIAEKYRYPGDDPDSLYGGLYQWSEAMDYWTIEGVQGICPPGWRIPTDYDWQKTMSLFKDPDEPWPGTYSISNCRFIPDQTVKHFNYFATGAIWKLLKSTGGTGFDAILIGYRDPDGNFGYQDYHFSGETASFWTSTTDSIWAIRSRFYVNDRQAEIFRFADNRLFAFSIRCVKDE